MEYYPLFLDIRDKRCVVVGGGLVAGRKVKDLLSCGARVVVITPEMDKRLARLAAEGRIETIGRGYRRGDLQGAALVFAATGDSDLNRRISADAGRQNTPVNVVDNPGSCSFIVPAKIRKGNLTVAVSSGGSAPLAVKRVRQEMEKLLLDRGYPRYVAIVGAFRSLLPTRVPEGPGRRKVLKALARMEIGEVTRLGVRGLIKSLLQPGR